MYGIDTANSVASPPTPAPKGTEGWFKNGTPGGSNGTRVDADWLNCLMGNILYLLDDQSIPHSKDQPFDEITAAIASMIAEDVPAATTVLAGRSRLATLAEVQTGSDNTIAVTPAGLVSASEVNRGLAKLASLAEALAGSVADKIITPAALGQNHQTGTGPAMWAEFIGSGLVLQTASFSVNDGAIRTLPYTFADANFAPWCVTDASQHCEIGISPYSASQVIFNVNSASSYGVFVGALGRA